MRTKMKFCPTQILAYILSYNILLKYRNFMGGGGGNVTCMVTWKEGDQIHYNFYPCIKYTLMERQLENILEDF
jgi:hypothetical protein